MSRPAPCVLTIAGSDSGGGAGIQADLKTFMMLGCYGASVITALTAQNTLGVLAVHVPDADFLARQMDAVLSDLPIRAAKTGMLQNADIVRAVARKLRDKTFPLVVDPVMLAKGGQALLEPEAVRALAGELVPLADLITPNRPEAEHLSGVAIRDQESLFEAMDRLLALGCANVLIKGGHMPAEQGGTITDWLGRPNRPPLALRVKRVDTPHTHGTGCTLSAAVTAGLGLGQPLVEAIRHGQAYLNEALSSGFAVGRGISPPNHLAPWQRLMEKNDSEPLA
jgi:hydroxymethylpyrimidine/phosphomethylpyrimidine kinase